MEGLKGTAIRSAVRDPSCPQAPVFPGARRLRVLVRGCSCRWLRPRPPIPLRTTVSGQAARRVARSAAGTGAPDLTSGIKSRASPGITGTSCTRQILPVSTKASPARLEAGMDPAGRPAVLTKGSQPWTALAVACHVPIRTACFFVRSTTRSPSTAGAGPWSSTRTGRPPPGTRTRPRSSTATGLRSGRGSTPARG